MQFKVANNFFNWLFVTLNKPEQVNDPLPSVPIWQHGWPIFSDWSVDNAIQHGLKASVWVYRCIMRRAHAKASVPWIVEEQLQDGNWARYMRKGRYHDVEALLRQPNPHWSGRRFFELASINLDLCGNSTNQVIWVDDKPLELWPINPSWIKPIPDLKSNNWELAYRFMMGGVLIDVPPEQVLHFQFPDPSDPYWGMSPLMAAANVVDADREAVKWNRNALNNRAVADIAIIPKTALTQKQYDEGRAQLQDQHMGSARAYTPWFFSQPSDIQKMAFTALEMDWLKGRQMNAEEICAAFGTPYVLIIGEQKSARMNQDHGSVERDWWVNTIIPELDSLADYLNLGIMQAWDDRTTRGKGEIRIRYDTSAVPALQENFGEKVVNAQLLVQMGFPIDEVNSKLNMGFDPKVMAKIASDKLDKLTAQTVVNESPDAQLDNPAEMPALNDTGSASAGGKAIAAAKLALKS